MAQPRDKKRSDTAGISDVTGNFQLKPGLIYRVFRKDLLVEPFTGSRMALLHLQALVIIAVSLLVLMSLA